MRSRRGSIWRRVAARHRFFGDRVIGVKKSPFFSTGNSKQRATVQAKLRVGPANDKFEQEADSVADRVVQRMDSGEIGDAEPEAIQTKCTECEEKEKPRRQVDSKEPEQDVQRQSGAAR